MSTEYFVINREAFELDQCRRTVWYNAIEDAIQSFSQAIQKSGVLESDCESVGIDEIIKLQDKFDELFPLNVIKLGNTWCSDKGIRFVRYFGQTSRSSPEQIWEDIKTLIKNDFEYNLIINEYGQEVPWNKFKEIIFSTIQRTQT